MTQAVPLESREVEALVESSSWHERKALAALLGRDAERAAALEYSCGPDLRRPEFALLAETGARRRALVMLKPPGSPAALVVFDLAPAPRQQKPLNLKRFRVKTDVLNSEGRFLCVVQFSENETAPSAVEFTGSVDLDGARIGDWIVLFHNEPNSAREPQFFFVDRGGPVKCLVAGLAPGLWELWHNGFVKEQSLEVSPRAGALYFEGAAGSYFFRRYR